MKIIQTPVHIILATNTDGEAWIVAVSLYESAIVRRLTALTNDLIDDYGADDPAPVMTTAEGLSAWIADFCSEHDTYARYEYAVLNPLPLHDVTT